MEIDYSESDSPIVRKWATILNFRGSPVAPISLPEPQESYIKPEKRGCTDKNAINYDPFATIDDGSAVYF